MEQQQPQEQVALLTSDQHMKVNLVYEDTEVAYPVKGGTGNGGEHGKPAQGTK